MVRSSLPSTSRVIRALRPASVVSAAAARATRRRRRRCPGPGRRRRRAPCRRAGGGATSGCRAGRPVSAVRVTSIRRTPAFRVERTATRQATGVEAPSRQVRFSPPKISLTEVSSKTASMASAMIAGHREHLDLVDLLLGRQRQRVGDHDLGDHRVLEPVDGRAGEHAVGGHGPHLGGAVLDELLGGGARSCRRCRSCRR